MEFECGKKRCYCACNQAYIHTCIYKFRNVYIGYVHPSSIDKRPHSQMSWLALLWRRLCKSSKYLKRQKKKKRNVSYSRFSIVRTYIHTHEYTICMYCYKHFSFRAFDLHKLDLSFSCMHYNNKWSTLYSNPQQ